MYSILYILTGLFSASYLNAGVDAALNEDMLIAGTPARVEVESKLAYMLPPAKKYERSLRAHFKKLTQSIAQSVDNLPHYLNHKSGYQSTLPDESIFYDTYFDNAQKTLLNHSASYRLRYRWKDRRWFYMYQWMPFMSLFYPTRCEVQFKHNYRQQGKFIAVDESRFEFRNEADPFKNDQSAPSAPWPYEEYVEYARTGVFRNYAMQPSRNLANFLLSQKADLEVYPVYQVMTTRYHSHLLLKDNPWPTGPNPDHAFIMTMDIVKFKPADNDQYYKNSFVEIEIEMDRNITTELSADYSEKLSDHLLEDSTKIDARRLLEKDHAQIVDFFNKSFFETFKIKPISPKYKYRRMSEISFAVSH